MFENNTVTGISWCASVYDTAVLTARNNSMTGCLGGWVQDSGELRVSGNDGMAEGDVTVSENGRVSPAG